jgi:23S rRNA (pseudouridine1915-N3)-methyltransferase
MLERWILAARSLSFVIGGSAGLDAALITRANASWSLGPLTFPHELARIIVLEQLYRAFTILRGEPYHKGV